MQVEIFSLMAAVSGCENVTWKGDVPDLDKLKMLDYPIDDARLDFCFRCFNRVNEADGERLETMGYRLPSLSVGDYIAFDGKCWQVRGLGFKLVTHDADILMRDFV